MNAIEIAREEAAKANVKLDESALEYIIWEETGWPAFFDGDPETCFREQLRKVLEPIGAQQRAALQESLPTRLERIRDEG
jgi:hypothetical protein